MILKKLSSKLSVIIILFFTYNLSAATAVPSLSLRNSTNLEKWIFTKGSPWKAEKNNTNTDSWENVTVPHTYNKDALNGPGYYQGMAWYRTKVSKGQYKMDERIFIRFEGVGQETIVYLNGKKVGTHNGGYSAFVFELTKNWNYDGDNLIAVRVDNTTNHKIIPVNNFLFNLYGGIYRPVALFSTPQNCIDPTYYASSGVFVETKSVQGSNADIELRVHLSNVSSTKKTNLKIEIKDASGNIVITESKVVEIEDENIEKFNIKISDASLWNGTINPYLYSAKVTLTANGQTDVVTVPFGIRTFEVNADNGFYLNGKPYKVNGVCRHQEWEQYANALSNEHHKIDMDLIREVGATGIRFAHYQQADYMYQLADEYGMIVWAEIPQVHTWTGSEHQNAKNQLKELILQNYNHPSICFWGLFNEVRGFNKKDAPCVRLTKQLNQIAHELDPTRLTTSATDRDMGDSMNDISDLQGWNKYLGWYGNDAYDFIGQFFDKIHEKYPHIKISVSEYGAGANIEHQDIKKSEKPLGNYFPEQGQTKCHEEAWNQIRQRDYLWGSFLWNMFDFGVNQWYRGGVNHLNHKGLITFDRRVKKDAFYFYKANWNNEPMIYLTERRHVNRTTPMVEVKAYCNLTTNVTLYVNGEKFGKVKPDDIKVVKWDNVTLKQGRNIVKVCTSYKGEIFTDTVVWTYSGGEGI